MSTDETSLHQAAFTERRPLPITPTSVGEQGIGGINFTASIWEQQGWVLHELNVWSEEPGTTREHKTDAQATPMTFPTLQCNSDIFSLTK